MISQCGTAEFRRAIGPQGEPVITVTDSWLGPPHGWNEDNVNGGVYQQLEYLPRLSDGALDLDKLPIFNVLACIAKRDSGRRILVDAVRDGNTLQTHWAWEEVSPQVGTLVLGETQVAGKSSDYQCLQLTEKAAPTMDRTQHTLSISITKAHGDMISGKVPCTSFFLLIEKLKDDDPALNLFPVKSAGGRRPIRTRVQVVEKIYRPTMAYVDVFKGSNKGLDEMKKFGVRTALAATVDQSMDTGGASYVKLSEDQWTRFSTLLECHGH
jgi:hypothetical protein